jgi:hypothetical protein
MLISLMFMEIYIIVESLSLQNMEKQPLLDLGCLQSVLETR